MAVVYAVHPGYRDGVDEEFFKDNIIMIIHGNLDLKQIYKSEKELSLLFKTTVKHSNDSTSTSVPGPVPPAVTGYIFKMLGIKRDDLSGVDTISVAVEAINN